MKTDPDDFAFSRADGVQARSFPGLTKREYFAGEAMKGMIAHEGEFLGHTSRCLAYVDALIAELNKEPT